MPARSNIDREIGNEVSFVNQCETLRLIKLYYAPELIAKRLNITLSQVTRIVRNGMPIEPRRRDSVHIKHRWKRCPKCGVDVVMPCMVCDLKERREYAKRLESMNACA